MKGLLKKKMNINNNIIYIVLRMVFKKERNYINHSCPDSLFLALHYQAETKGQAQWH